ncbi:MAG: hypothetical protein INR70_37290 [Parafilimonas terrae]|nr:hypothetical protein [Parafilimonas terrae]
MIADSKMPVPVASLRDPWARFARDILLTGLGLGLAVVAFIALVDPYGLRAAPGHPPGPIVDTDQRWSYPQVARGGAFDAAVFGSSTSRLLDPTALDAAFGARFANLAMNAATPDEQLRLAALFLAGKTPKVVLFGLDASWCEAAPAARTAITFPDWLYEPSPRFGFLRQVNLRSLEAAVKAAEARWGHGRPAIRADGYAVFTPPESTYDLARARNHLAAATRNADPIGEPMAAPMSGLDRLDALLGRLPTTTRTILVFMPVHVRAQAREGTSAGDRERACKDCVAAIGAHHHALVVDFRYPSPVTTDDANYWDALHYRLPVAARIVASLAEAARGAKDDSGGLYRVLSP